MSFDTYLYIPNVSGESINKAFPNQIEVYSFSLGFSNPANFSNPGGQSGKASVSDFNILKKYDKSSPVLLRNLVQGTNIAPVANSASIVVSLVPSGNSSNVAYLTYTFQDVYVTGISDSGSSGGDSVPTQSISFGYGVVRESYRVTNPDGSLGNPIMVAYNVETNRAS